MHHLCNTKEGSSGSPILSLKSHKVIGIHIGSYEFNFNKGVFIKYPIIEFDKKNNHIIFKSEIKSDIINIKHLIKRQNNIIPMNYFSFPIIGLNDLGKESYMNSVL